MSCTACADFESGKVGSYRPPCLECRARSIAASPAFHRCRQAGDWTDDVIETIEAQFNGDIELGKERVRHWAKRLSTRSKS